MIDLPVPPTAESIPTGGTASRMADLLVAYQRRYGLDDLGLAAWLGIDVDVLFTLALSPLPDPRSPDFSHAMRRVATASNCDLIRLVLLVTEGLDPAGC